jgi:16S rRNA (guanine(527)-N(7))-methyltransferase RsmG
MSFIRSHVCCSRARFFVIRNLSLMRAEFIEALRANEAPFGLKLDDETVDQLADHFEIVQQNNEFLHLTGPSSVSDFAVRHTLESLALINHLPRGARFADIGPGGGFPSLPCLIARADTSAVLVESKEKKAEFLRQAVETLGLTNRVEIIARQFEEVTTKDFSVVTCRALDKFVYKLPRLLKWSKGKQFVFFGGPALEEALRRSKTSFEKQLLPLSEQRYLFVSR